MTKTFFSLSIAIAAVLGINQFACLGNRSLPEIKQVTDIKITEMNSDTIKLSMDVITENKNDFDLDLSCLSLIIMENKDSLGRAVNNGEISIPSKSTGSMNLSVNLETKKTAALLTRGNDTISLNLKGTLKADMKMFSVPVDLDMPFKFSLKDNLFTTIKNDTKKDKTIKIQRALLRSIGLASSMVDIEFILKNPYGLNIRLKEYPSEIYINGKYAGKGNISAPITLENKGDKENGVFKFELDNFKSLGSIINTVLSRQMEYESRGTLILEVSGYEIKFPYSFKGDLLKNEL